MAVDSDEEVDYSKMDQGKQEGSLRPPGILILRRNTVRSQEVQLELMLQDRVLERNPQPRPGDCLEVSSSGSGSRKAMNKSRNTVEKGAEPHRWEVCGMSASPRL